MLNAESILNFKREPREDYYGILGCDQVRGNESLSCHLNFNTLFMQSSNVEQILAEFKIRAKQLHPDKNKDDPDCAEKFKQLQTVMNALGISAHN